MFKAYAFYMVAEKLTLNNSQHSAEKHSIIRKGDINYG